MRVQTTPCDSCGTPVRLGATGWGRCYLCGTEMLRDAVEAAPFVPSYAELYSRDESEYVCAAAGGAGLVSLLNNGQGE